MDLLRYSVLLRGLPVLQYDDGVSRLPPNQKEVAAGYSGSVHQQHYHGYLLWGL